MSDIDVHVTEVGPRDGLQNAEGLMQTEDKLAWIEAEFKAGVKEIEVCSFVPPKLIPAMRDASDVTSRSAEIKGLMVTTLVPNFKGAERAIEAGAHKVSMPISVSKSHCVANIRKTPDEAVEEFAEIVTLCKDTPVEAEVGLSTAFGCTIEGAVDEKEVVRLAVAIIDAGASSISLSDTVGYANPAQVARVFKAVRAEVGDKVGAAHLHNTRGLGLANVVAALEADVRSFDASLGGLGGCPFAPGASGNIVTEDLVFMLDAMGMKTGIDLDALVACREIIKKGLPEDEIYGYFVDAGRPRAGAAT
jgi:hydroxymethylglutaryl-CoA lyase